MVARRLTNAARDKDGRPPPVASVARARRLRAVARARYELAQTERERLTIALDYVRVAAAAATKAGVAEVSVIAAEVTRAAMAAGDALLARLAARRPPR